MQRLSRNNGDIALYKRSANPACEACGWMPPIRGDWQLLHCHHILPLWADGTNERHNLTILCPNHHATAHRLFPRRKRGATYLGLLSKTRYLRLLRLYDKKPEDAIGQRDAIVNENAARLAAPFIEGLGQPQPTRQDTPSPDPHAGTISRSDMSA